MSSIIDMDIAATALPTTAIMSSQIIATSNPYQELLERVIRRENTSVIRVVWYVIEQTKRGHKEVEASYSQLQTALNLSRCGVNLGVSRALEAGYIIRTNNNNNNTGSGNGGGKGRNNNDGSVGGSRGVSGDHATARYVVNLPLPPITPDPPVGDMQSDNQTTIDNEDKGAADGSNEQAQEGQLPQQLPQAQAQQEGSVNQTGIVNSRSRSFLFSDLSPDSNIESFIELEEIESPVEVESLVPDGTSVGKPERQPAEAQGAAGDEEEEGNGDDNEPDGGLHTAPSTTEPQEQPHAQSQAEAEAGVRARSEYLANLSRDFSRELGDLAHGRSNVTQIHNLWRESGLSEKEFGALLYQSRDLTRRYAVLRPGETPPPGGKPRNRMAYFFTVVRNMLGLRPAAAPASTPALAAATSAAASASAPARPNLRSGWGAREYNQAQVQPQAKTNNQPLPQNSTMSTQAQLAYRQRRQVPVLSSEASASAGASASNSSPVWSRANHNKTQAEKSHSQAKSQGQAVAPNGVKLLHASWLQFVR
jgi:hypothetical protein